MRRGKRGGGMQREEAALCGVDMHVLGRSFLIA